MEISMTRDRFRLAQVFTISRGSRTEAEVLTVELADGRARGRGECVPYARYGETPDSVAAQIEGLPEKNRHLANQLLRMLELAAGHDVAYFCEQDYVFRRGALEACADAFKSIPTLAVLSPFDHPDRHLPAQEPLLASPQVFPGTLTDWKAVSSTNGNFMWRMSFVAPRLAWVKKTLSAGGLDYALTNGVHAQGHVVLSPTTSLVQHIRTDGSNASPTFGPCVSLQMMARATRALRAASRSITTSNERRHRR